MPAALAGLVAEQDAERSGFIPHSFEVGSDLFDRSFRQWATLDLSQEHEIVDEGEELGTERLDVSEDRDQQTSAQGIRVRALKELVDQAVEKEIVHRRLASVDGNRRRGSAGTVTSGETFAASCTRR